MPGTWGSLHAPKYTPVRLERTLIYLERVINTGTVEFFLPGAQATFQLRVQDRPGIRDFRGKSSHAFTILNQCVGSHVNAATTKRPRWLCNTTNCLELASTTFTRLANTHN